MSTEDKIRKLINLARGAGTPQEAAAAWGVAQRMATLHHLDLADLDEQPDAEPPVRSVEEIETITLEELGRRCAWRITIACGIAASLSCSVMTRRRNGGVEVAAYGEPTALATVRSTYIYMRDQCLEMARQAQRSRPRGVSARSYAHDYRVGYAVAISERMQPTRQVLEAAQRAADPGTTAIARVETAIARVAEVERALDKWRRDQNLRSGRTFTRSRGETQGYRDGVRDGQIAHVRTPVAITGKA